MLDEQNGAPLRLVSPVPGLLAPDVSASQAAALAAGERAREQFLERERAGGRVPVGYKIGLTDPALRKALDAPEPVHGTIFADAVRGSGCVLRMAECHLPRVETEIAFVLGSDLGGADCTAADVLAATRVLRPAFEVTDNHLGRRARSLTELIADNVHGGFAILGATEVAPEAVQLGDVEVTFYVDDVLVERGTTGRVMGNPAAAVAWLCRDLARVGRGLRTGDIVLSGSCTAPLDADAGHRMRSSITGFGEVEVAFDV